MSTVYIESYGSTLEEIPLTPELASLSDEFFFQHEGKTYFNFFGAYTNSLKRKERTLAKFLKSNFKVKDLSGIDKVRYILEPTGEKLTREQIDYVTETYDKSHSDIEYVHCLADHGDIDYFEEALKKKALPLDRKLTSTFVARMIECGREGLLEAYEKYGLRRPIFRIKTYHQDQKKIKEINQDYISLLELNTHEKRFSKIKELREGGDHLYTNDAMRREDFVKWVIKEHPEVLEDWYRTEVKNVDLIILRGIKPNSGAVSNHLIDNIANYTGKWEDLDSTFNFSDNILKYILSYIITKGRYKRFFEILKWNKERTLNALQQAVEKNVYGLSMLPPHSLSFGYLILLAYK